MLSNKNYLSVFLFAHQDDEAFIFQKIEEEIENKNEIICIFMTSGVKLNNLSKSRENESLNVLQSLGVKQTNIYFAGSKNNIPDLNLINNLNEAYDYLEKFIKKYQNISKIYIPAWEGGHPDHDSLHAVTVLIAKKYNLIESIYQYPLYNGYRCFRPFFRTLSPLQENGDIVVQKIKWYKKIKYLRLCLKYPSQKLTWIGLLPMFLIHYAFWGTQVLQKVSAERIFKRPHHGKLYYERRNFDKYDNVAKKINEFTYKYKYE